MATARQQNLRACMGRASVGRCRACEHNGHAQAWCTHAMNNYAHPKGSVDIGFVDVNATGHLRASGQCRCMDMGRSGVTELCHVAFAMEARRTLFHSVGRKSMSSRSLLSTTLAQRWYLDSLVDTAQEAVTIAATRGRRRAEQM